MTDRFVAVLAPEARCAAAPPGIDPDEFGLALLEDTYEVAAGLELVRPALILPPLAPPTAEEITWPGTLVVRPAPWPGQVAGTAALPAALDRFRELGAATAAVLAPDAPDLPPLMIGKLFRALSHAPAAACRADGGGLVALAVRLPMHGWLTEALQSIDLDTPDAFEALRGAAPRPGMIQSGPGWHRLRRPEDVGRLDPGLEGWENTRALLSGQRFY